MLAGSEARRRAGTTGGGGTAASVVSASTTTASSSLTSAFASLSPQDIAFFDHLILHSLPRTASDFASLKQVYDHSGSPDSPIRWDTLLRLVHVRGRTWAERWEAVRLALGLSPHSSSEDSESSTSTTTDRRRQGSSYNRNHIHDQHSQSAGSNADSDSSFSHQQQQHRTPTAQLSSRQRTLQALTARAGSLAQGARAAATASAIRSSVSRSTLNTPRPTRPTPLTKQATVADAPTDSDSEDDLFASDGQPPRGAARIAELSRSRSTSGKAVLADLIRAIQSISMDQSNTSSPSHSQPQVATRSPLTSTRQVDMLTSRMAPTTTRQRREPPSLRASHAELSFSREYEHLSHASSPTLLPPSSPATATAATAAAASSTPRSRQPLSQPTHRPQQSQQQQLKQHIATVVQRARAERDRIRHSASPSSAHARLLLSPAEADAETPEDPILVQAATQFHARTLALKAFSWWITLTRRSHARTAHITRIRNDLLLRRALAHWIHRALYTREIEERAVQIDQIRVLVGSWNTWLDQVRVRVEDKKESERSRLRAAFGLIVERRMGRSKRHFLDRWKRACQTRLADSVRKEHLLRGALALWTLAASKMAALHLAEQDWEQGWGAHQKRQGWKMWRLKVLERQEWERRKTERRRIELEDAFNYWKRAA
ncbi:hypothetical protein OC845_004844 [Tilletia horrida]|nr:hypothetical protein OC845_004844 [Tilletia horrida]